MRRSRFFTDTSFVDQLLHDGMVSRAHNDPTAAYHVEATVADMRPVRPSLLDQAGHNARARRVAQSPRTRLVEDCCMRALDGPRKEKSRVGDLWPRLCRKSSTQVVHCHLRRHFPVRVAAQAVCDHHQQRLRGSPMAEAVLVGLSAATAAFSPDGELHRSPEIMVLSCLSKGTGDTSAWPAPRSAFWRANPLCGRRSGSSWRHASMVSSSWAEYRPAAARRAEISVSPPSRRSAEGGGVPVTHAYSVAPTQ